MSLVVSQLGVSRQLLLWRKATDPFKKLQSFAKEIVENGTLKKVLHHQRQCMRLELLPLALRIWLGVSLIGELTFVL